jgi:hypothetical protein
MSEDIQKEIIKNDDEVFIKVSLKQMKELTAYIFASMDILTEIRDSYKKRATENLIPLLKEIVKESKPDELTPSEAKQEIKEEKEEPKLTTQLKCYYKNHERRREEAKLRARKKKEEAYLKEHGNLEGFKIKEYVKYKK